MNINEVIASLEGNVGKLASYSNYLDSNFYKKAVAIA